MHQEDFYLSFSGKLSEFGCEKSLLNPAMFLFFDKEVTREDEIRRPSGIAVTHVDDVLHAGNDMFEKKVMKPLKDSFKFGTEEEIEFRYVGLHMKQSSSGISVDQDHYVNNLEEPTMNGVKNLKVTDVLSETDQTEF